MSQRAKARMVVAEAEDIARQAAEGDDPDEPVNCQVCGHPPTGAIIFITGGVCCFTCHPGAQTWEPESETWQPSIVTPDDGPPYETPDGWL